MDSKDDPDEDPIEEEDPEEDFEEDPIEEEDPDEEPKKEPLEAEEPEEEPLIEEDLEEDPVGEPLELEFTLYFLAPMGPPALVVPCTYGAPFPCMCMKRDKCGRMCRGTCPTDAPS